MLDRLGTRGNLNAVFSGESALILDLRLCGLALPFDLRLPKANGGSSGKTSPISYRQLFWLLDPEFSTRIFMRQ